MIKQTCPKCGFEEEREKFSIEHLIWCARQPEVDDKEEDTCHQYK